MASTTTAAPGKANGLATYFSILWAPTEAFERLRVSPTWGWAALVGIVLLLIASIMSMPEIAKVAHIAQDQALSQMPADRQAVARQGIAATQGIFTYIAIGGAVVGPWIIWIISAIVYTIGGALSGSGAKFGLAWVVSVNVAIIAFVGSIVNSVILVARGPDAITSPIDQFALPSLGMFVHDNVKLATFLNSYNVDYVWLYVVAIIALERTLLMKRGGAIATVVIYSLIAAGLASAFAR